MFELDIDSYSAQFTVSKAVNNSFLQAAEPREASQGENSAIIASSFLELGILYWRQEDFDRAEQLITKAQEISATVQDIPLLVQCFTGLALVKTRLEKVDEAIDAYCQAIKLEPKNIQLWNNVGNLYLRHNRLEEALSAYKQSLFINPNNAAAWNGLANVYDQKGNINDAIISYKRTIELNPALEPEQAGKLPSELAHTYSLPWLRLARLYNQKNQYQEAKAAYQSLLSFNSCDSNLWNEFADVSIKLGDYHEAEVALQKSIGLDPAFGQTYLKLAGMYAKLGKYQASIPVYLKSIEKLSGEQERKSASKMLEDAVTMIRQKNSVIDARNKVEDDSLQGKSTWFYSQYSEEISSSSLASPTAKAKNAVKKPVGTLQKGNYARRITFNSARNRKNRGKNMTNFFSLYRSKRSTAFRANKTSTLETIRNDSTNPFVWNEKGNFHFKNQQFEEALNAYLKAIELDPKFGQAHHNLALIHYITGDYYQAIQNYQTCIGLLTTDREKAIAWNGLGNVHRCIGDYKNAREAYQNASKLDIVNGGIYENAIIFDVSEKSKTAEFWNDLGELFFKNGVYEKAALAFREAIRIEPSSGYVYAYLARTLTAQGKYKEAVPYYQKSIELAQNDREKAIVWNRLGDVHRKLNDYNNALNAYQNAMILRKDNLRLLNRTRLSLLSNCASK